MLRATVRCLTLLSASLIGISPIVDTLPAIAQQYTPPRRGTPGRREGGGTRGPCLRGDKRFTALIPADAFGATLSNSPTFSWYLPKTRATKAELTLYDYETQDEVYSTIVPLPTEPGIVVMRLPSASVAPRLATDKPYSWLLSLICSKDEPSLNPFVGGVIQQFPADSALEKKIQAASLNERASIYAANGIWQDAIVTLAQQRCSQPNNPKLLSQWTNLLRSVKLDAYANEPLQFTCSDLK